MITVAGTGQTVIYGINKHYDEWVEIHVNHTKPVPNGVLVDSDITSTPRGTSETDETSTPLSTNQYPVEHKPVPNGVLKPVPNGVHTKDIKDTTKDTSKDRETFEEYRERLRGEFTDVDFDGQLEEFELYNTGTRKRPIVNMKLALLRWMKNARRFKERDDNKPGNNGKQPPLPRVSTYFPEEAEVREFERLYGRTPERGDDIPKMLEAKRAKSA
jgi:hypothetical protein